MAEKADGSTSRMKTTRMRKRHTCGMLAPVAVATKDSSSLESRSNTPDKRPEELWSRTVMLVYCNRWQTGANISMFEPVRGGTRGGQAEFKWSDVSADKDREVSHRPALYHSPYSFLS